MKSEQTGGEEGHTLHHTQTGSSGESRISERGVLKYLRRCTHSAPDMWPLRLLLV